MTYQAINLGTPNNNDGDSLYAGGTKINNNFVELYTALSGSTAVALRVNVGSTIPGTSVTLVWSTASQAFIPSSSDAIRTLGANSASSVYLTNDSGVSGGVNSNLLGAPNTLYNFINGRQIFNVRARTTGSVVNTRAEVNFGLGQANVTSLSIYTTSVVVRGLRGIEIYRASAEDTASYTKLMDTTSTATGLTLYQTPSLDIASMSAGVRTGTDSSAAVAHTGFVALNLTKYVQSSLSITAQRGVVSATSSLSQNLAFNVDGIYHPKHCEGLIYNYDVSSNLLTLVTGAACHWSYNTSGVAGISPLTSIALVASYTPIIRTFVAGWTPAYNDAGSTPAVIDATVQPNTWYYLYYIGCLQQHTVGGRVFYPGSSNVVVSSNRDIASVDAQLRAGGFGPAGPTGYWQVVRRLGPVKTDSQATPRLLPFNVKRIDHGAFEYYWGLNASGPAFANGADTAYTTTVSATGIKIISSSVTYTLQDFSGTLLPAIPPLPGVTAHLTVKHRPGGTLPLMYLYGEAWTVNSSISTLYPPFEVLRSMSTGITNLHNILLPMSPDGCYIPDGTYNGAGILSVTTSTGQRVRFLTVHPNDEGGKTLVTSTLLQFTVTGFRLAR